MRTTFEQFFAGKFLKIPAYQRDYAWMKDNIDEIWEDIEEALRIDVPHYIGTFILARKPGQVELDVVDGQQRLTTLTMIVRAFVETLPDGPERIVATDHLARQERNRLTLLGDNQAFFQGIVQGAPVEPQTRGQRRLQDALRIIRDRVAVMPSPAMSAPSWLAGIGRLQVLEFVEENEGNAIRIFETVNDRGRPLSVLEKIKSHLIFASNKYLSGSLDNTLSERFGTVFRAYDSIKELGSKAGLDVELINQKKFTEDSILRYHFFAFPSSYHDWSFTAQGVLDDFLKDEIRALVTSADKATSVAKLEAFIDDYTRDLVAFFEAFLRVLHRARTQPLYYKLLTGLGLSTMLYPLLIRLETHDLLEAAVPDDAHTMLHLIEVADVRVYKTGGRSPERDVYTCAKDATPATLKETAARLRNFIGAWMGDDSFRARLRGVTYKQNDAGRYILQEHEADVRAKAGLPALTVADLQKMRADDITIEHALAQEPTFSLDGRGFSDGTDYSEQIDRLGNLTLLEHSVNSAASKKTPEQKAASSDLYSKSAYLSTRRFAAEIQAKFAPFNRADVEARTAVLVEFCAGRWSL